MGKMIDTTVWKPKPPISNADRIRKMSDEELATWISCLASIQYKIGADPHFWLEWLQREVQYDEP